ncbi:hypothetical protein ACFVZW_36420 [Streptomyces sp. NPDC059567]|uniref:hypothetical protein n=1 Tax=Streptomyces sp. NPDC059567 TaxID=3346867 RepID=UPI0036C3AE1A
MALDGAMLDIRACRGRRLRGVPDGGIRAALVAGDLKRGWELRREAWRYADLLPPGKTRKQRRALGQYKVLLLAAQKNKRDST